MELILKYQPQDIETLFFSPQGAAMYKVWDARGLVLDREAYFARYYTYTMELYITAMTDVNKIVRFMALQKFDAVSKALGVVMKKSHTVIEPWPTALKLRHNQKGGREAFELLLASSCSGVERYVEWKRAE
jgi:hypothetical protein